MNSSSPHRKEIILLTEAFLEGTLDDVGAARLDRLVSEDPEAARLYVRYIELHGELSGIYRGQTPPPPSVPLLNGLLTDNQIDLLGGSEEQGPVPGQGSTGPILGWFGIIAITLVMSVLVIVTLWWNPQGGLQNMVAMKPKVAKLTAASNEVRCQDLAATVGSPLVCGDRLSLDEGTAEITYETGAKVWVKGPATYVVSDTNEGILEEGNLSASVPPEAIGFVVDTLGGTVTDQGTEFDVRVRKEGDETTTDVQVVKGAVDVASPRDKNAKNRYTSGEAVRTSSVQSGHQANGLALSQDDSFDPRSIKGMRLWLRADAAVMRDDQGRATEIIDLVGGSNKTAENFYQAEASKRPLWVDHGLNGRATLRFTGKQYLQLANKSDLNFKDESLTIFVVGKASDHTQYFLSSIATRGKDEGRGFRFTTSPDCGLRYWGGKSAQVSRECAVTKQACVLTAVHDRQVPGQNAITLFCNGRQLGQTEPVPDANLGNAYPVMIGANPEAIQIFPDSPQNYLHGELAEILIYDCVLTELEQQRIESYLQTRYGLGTLPRAGDN